MACVSSQPFRHFATPNAIHRILASLSDTYLSLHCSYPLLKDGWNFHLTPTLQSSIDAFTSWYTTQHKNRVLSWRYQLATVTLTARFPSGRYEVGVSLFQAVVLLLYNEVESLTFAEIKERTGIGKLLYSPSHSIKA